MHDALPQVHQRHGSGLRCGNRCGLLLRWSCLLFHVAAPLPHETESHLERKIDAFLSTLGLRAEDLKSIEASQPGGRLGYCGCPAEDVLRAVPLRLPSGGALSLKQQRLDEVLRMVMHHLDVRHDNEKCPAWNSSTSMCHWDKCMLCPAREDPKRAPSFLEDMWGKQVLIDDHVVASAEGVERVSGDHVDVGAIDVPDFARFPGSINHNGSHFLMHYTGLNDCSLRLALSTDLLSWARGPELIRTSAAKGRDACFGKTETEQDHCVTLDLWPDRIEHRFKMVYRCDKCLALGKDEDCYAGDLGLCIATSADGISWKDHGLKRDENHDAVSCIYHEGPAQGYTMIPRREYPTPNTCRDIRGTLQLHATEEDFLWGLRKFDRRIKFREQGEWYFDWHGKYEKYQRVPYWHTRVLHERIFIGIVWLLEWPFPCCPSYYDSIENAWGKYSAYFGHRPRIDAVVPYLVTSRDGIHYNFQWIYGKQAMSFSRDATLLEPQMNLLTHAGFHWFFYGQTQEPHRHLTNQRLFLAKYPQDRLTGLEATGGVEGHILTKRFRWPAGAAALVLNADVPTWAPHSSLGVTLVVGTVAIVQSTVLPNKKRGFEVCIPIYSLDIRRMHASLPFDQAALRFDLAGSARLFAFTVLRQGEAVPEACSAGGPGVVEASFTKTDRIVTATASTRAGHAGHERSQRQRSSPEGPEGESASRTEQQRETRHGEPQEATEVENLPPTWLITLIVVALHVPVTMLIWYRCRLKNRQQPVQYCGLSNNHKGPSDDSSRSLPLRCDLEQSRDVRCWNYDAQSIVQASPLPAQLLEDHRAALLSDARRVHVDESSRPLPAAAAPLPKGIPKEALQSELVRKEAAKAKPKEKPPRASSAQRQRLQQLRPSPSRKNAR